MGHRHNNAHLAADLSVNDVGNTTWTDFWHAHKTTTAKWLELTRIVLNDSYMNAIEIIHLKFWPPFFENLWEKLNEVGFC